jgi:hypothetical protein
MKAFRALLLGLPLLLAACGGSGWTTFRSDAHRVTFAYPGTLRETSADQWETPSGPMYAQEIAYDDPSDGLGDWSLPLTVRNQLATYGACGALGGSGVYLPIDFARPFVCEVRPAAEGRPATLLAAGFGQTSEGTSFRQSLMAVLDSDRVLLLEGIAPLQPYDAAMTALIADHPQAQFPNAEFQALNGKMDALLRAQFSPPSADIQGAMAVMRRIADSLRLMP